MAGTMRPLASLLLAQALLAVPASAAVNAAPPSPAEHLGHAVGADRKLADYHQVVSYLEKVDAASDRLTLLHLGKTTLGDDLVVAAISSAANLANSARLREVATRLADPRGLAADEEARLLAEGRVIVLVTFNIHATEIAASQLALELAWDLAVQSDPAQQRWLEDVVLLLVPSLNPDGQIMVTEWYREQVGTPYEGGAIPRLYHHYAGHDNNRDWFMLNLAETRLLNRLLYHDWHPQVFVDEHQMGMTGPRLFLPPFDDPLGVRVHPLIWRQIDRVGTAMALRLQEAGKSGVVQSAGFDGYWLGGTRNTGWYKNVVGLLTEAASARIATPIYVDPGELSGEMKGLPNYRRQANFPDPWAGGWWRLRDILDYEKILTLSLLETASAHRREILADQVRMAHDAIEFGRPETPAGWVVPAGQRDPAAAAGLVELLREHGVEVQRAPDGIAAGRAAHPPGSFVVRADQPYRAFAAEVLSPQQYPEIRTAPGGSILLPYDVNSWSLPYLFGVEVAPLEGLAGVRLEPLGAAPVAPPGQVRSTGATALLSPIGNAASTAVQKLLAAGAEVSLALGEFTAAGRDWPAGTVIARRLPAGSRLEQLARETAVTFERTDDPLALATLRLHLPRVALCQGFVPSMDEGWTRFVLDRHGFAYETVGTERVKRGDLAAAFDVLILPSEPKAEIMNGWDRSDGYRPEMPPAYRGGIGADGVKAIAAFVEAGGTLIALDASAELPITEMNLPVSRPLAKLKEAEFHCPGSMLRARLDPGHPLGFGLPVEIAVMFAESQPFDTVPPGGDATRRVVARFADEPLLLSGWIKGEERLRRTAALVEVGKGKGRVILFGFRPQFRAQTVATFKLLLNAIHYGASEPATLTD